jgi:tetratricopeptide (TPR) repeat protein
VNPTTSETTSSGEPGINRDRAGAQEIDCPSCGTTNPAVNEFCTACGAALGEHTQVAGIVSSMPAATWRVYGVETGIFGRDEEFAAIAASFRAAVEGPNAHLVVLTGPEGIGKSRLISRFHEELERLHDGAHLVSGVARETGGPAFALFNSMVRARFYIPESLAAEPTRRRLLEAVRATVKSPSADEIAHLTGYLIGLPFPDSPFYERYDDDPARILERARQGLIRLLKTDAEAQPLVLVFDEVHHADPESLELIRHLWERLQGSPILILCLTRSGLSARARWMFEPAEHKTVIQVRDLGDEDVRELVSNILRRCEEVPEELFTLVAERAYGNPMSVEQVLRLLIAEGVIDTRVSPWTVDVDRLPEIELPTTFEGLVRARLTAVAPEERAILAKAAVVGKTFWLEAVQSLDRLEQEFGDDPGASWPGRDRDDRVREVLEQLNRKDIVRPVKGAGKLPGYTEFAFKHDIERRLLAEDLDPALRERYHAVVAQWLEVATSASAVRHHYLELIASHHEQGLNLAAAADAYHDAGRDAAAHYRNQTAAGNFEKALGFLGENALERRIQVLHDLGSVLQASGDLEAARVWFEELLQTAWLLGHKSKVAVGLTKLGETMRTLGRYDEAEIQLHRARSLFTELGDSAGIATSLGDIGNVHSHRGEYEAAQECYEAALKIHRQLDAPRSQALALNRLGAVRLSLGELEDALTFFREALELRRTIGDSRGVAESLNNIAYLCTERGHLDRAVALWREAEQVAIQVGDRNTLALVLNNIGEVLLRTGDEDGAQDALLRAVSIAEETGERRTLLDALRNLGDLQRQRGALDDALAHAERALSIARQIGTRGGEGVVLRTLAKIEAERDPQSGDANPAEERFKMSVDILKEIGLESELARTHRAYGEFLLDQKRDIEGRKHLAIADEIFERL